MKSTKIILAAVFFSLALFSYACNNVGYEIETTDEDGTVIKPMDSEHQTGGVVQTGTNTDNTMAPSTTNDEKKDEKSDEKSTKRYTIQIGAFSNELSARKFSDNAKATVNLDVSYSKIGELYKIRVGTFTSLSEAQVNLDKLLQQGYSDSFISEVGK